MSNSSTSSNPSISTSTFEASLIGSCFLYCIDDRLRNIKHAQTKYFGNIDMIFCGDLYQAQPIQDSLIFEQPTMNKQVITYEFWKENVKYQPNVG